MATAFALTRQNPTTGTITARAFADDGTAYAIAVAVTGTHPLFRVTREALGLAAGDAGYVIWYEDATAISHEGFSAEIGSTEMVASAAKNAMEAAGSSIATLLTRTQFLSAGDGVRVYWPPVGADGNTLFLKAADDYLDRSGTAIPLTVQTVADLTGATLIFGAYNRGNQILGTGTVVGRVADTDDQWEVLVEITRTEMDKPSGEYEYDLDAELAGDGDYTTIQSGTLFLQSNRTVRSAA